MKRLCEFAVLSRVSVSDLLVQWPSAPLSCGYVCLHALDTFRGVLGGASDFTDFGVNNNEDLLSSLLAAQVQAAEKMARRSCVIRIDDDDVKGLAARDSSPSDAVHLHAAPPPASSRPFLRALESESTHRPSSSQFVESEFMRKIVTNGVQKFHRLAGLRAHSKIESVDQVVDCLSFMDSVHKYWNSGRVLEQTTFAGTRFETGMPCEFQTSSLVPDDFLAFVKYVLQMATSEYKEHSMVASGRTLEIVLTVPSLASLALLLRYSSTDPSFPFSVFDPLPSTSLEGKAGIFFFRTLDACAEHLCRVLLSRKSFFLKIRLTPIFPGFGRDTQQRAQQSSEFFRSFNFPISTPSREEPAAVTKSKAHIMDLMPCLAMVAEFPFMMAKNAGDILCAEHAPDEDHPWIVATDLIKKADCGSLLEELFQSCHREIDEDFDPETLAGPFASVAFQVDALCGPTEATSIRAACKNRNVYPAQVMMTCLEFDVIGQVTNPEVLFQAGMKYQGNDLVQAYLKERHFYENLKSPSPILPHLRGVLHAALQHAATRHLMMLKELGEVILVLPLKEKISTIRELEELMSTCSTKSSGTLGKYAFFEWLKEFECEEVAPLVHCRASLPPGARSIRYCHIRSNNRLQFHHDDFEYFAFHLVRGEPVSGIDLRQRIRRTLRKWISPMWEWYRYRMCLTTPPRGVERYRRPIFPVAAEDAECVEDPDAAKKVVSKTTDTKGTGRGKRKAPARPAALSDTPVDAPQKSVPKKASRKATGRKKKRKAPATSTLRHDLPSAAQTCVLVPEWRGSTAWEILYHVCFRLNERRGSWTKWRMEVQKERRRGGRFDSPDE